ncbi:S1 family peptidase [Streptomyces sp. NPDC018031]|uniref:S1 family peptidase n=1 Tax=Streptomyces sp. NPDC018031 TaxID=3365033 RepID=UPI00378B82AD
MRSVIRRAGPVHPSPPWRFRSVLAALALAAPVALPAAGTTASAATGAPRAVAVRGGDVLYRAGGQCTVAFNARAGAVHYAVMPGHCAEPGTTWYADPARTVLAGTTAGASFPGNDYGFVRYTGTAVTHPGEVSLRNGTVRDITGAANPSVGQSLCHVGRVTGLRCGTVTGVNLTVHYPEGTVNGLFRSTICSEPGDTGGPAFAGTTALGFIVGAGGNCATGGTTYYQPIAEVLAAYGLTLY